MGEAMIIRAGGGYNSGSGSGEDKNIIGWQTKTEIFTTNGYFTVPKAKDQEFHVRLFGGGGGASKWQSADNELAWVGGGGGNMNNDTLIINQLESIQISIGSGGSYTNMDGYGQYWGGNGGTTAFGTYLSATGGQGGVKIWSGSTRGGSGGTGGGGGCFKGEIANGGNGTYGGGGGGCNNSNSRSNYCIGGTYGGNGNGGKGACSSGTNTMGNVELEFTGPGQRGIGSYYGGGGYGGSGGSSCGGGGGYGANGGNGSIGYFSCGGGGGGYGGKGGDAKISGGYYAGYGGGYGPENYGRGGGSAYSTLNGKSGCIIITYQAPIYKNAT